MHVYHIYSGRNRNIRRVYTVSQIFWLNLTFPNEVIWAFGPPWWVPSFCILWAFLIWPPWSRNIRASVMVDGWWVGKNGFFFFFNSTQKKDWNDFCFMSFFFFSKSMDWSPPLVQDTLQQIRWLFALNHSANGRWIGSSSWCFVMVSTSRVHSWLFLMQNVPRPQTFAGILSSPCLFWVKMGGMFQNEKPHKSIRTKSKKLHFKKSELSIPQF